MVVCFNALWPIGLGINQGKSVIPLRLRPIGLLLRRGGSRAFFFFCATHRTVDAHALHHIGAVLPRCLFAQQPTTKELYGTVMFLRNSDHAAPNLLWLSVLQIYQVDLQKMPYMNRSEHECMYTEFLCIVERRSS